MRYQVNIKFYSNPNNPHLGSTHKGEIHENVKTMKDAMIFESFIDNTVHSAWIHDNISGKISHWFKNPDNN